MSVVALDGVIRRYDWGSPTAIPELLGREPDGRPEAELWFGAHPDDPSPVSTPLLSEVSADSSPGETLEDVVDADPLATLGPAVINRFGPRLPFLLKVLAAGKALSIQVHPDLEQARRGYALEDVDGVALDAPNRNYRDANHKPELLCALTNFEALCGFRDPAETRDLLDALDVPELDFLSAALAGPDPLRAAFTAVLTHAEPGALSHAVGSALETAATAADLRLRGVRLAASDFPDDIGVVLALLLNHVELEPGEAIYLGAGNVHAYLRGTGVEIMANSDNVLRCGLTSKHIDVDEVLAVTDFVALADPRLPVTDGAFEVAVRDFRLTRLELDDRVTVADSGPLIVLCAEGEVGVGGGGGVALAPGHAAFVPAVQPVVELSGTGLVFVAGTRA